MRYEICNPYSLHFLCVFYENSLEHTASTLAERFPGACFPKDELVPDMGASLSYAIGQVVEKQRKREAKFWTAMSNQDGRILKLQKQVAELKEKLAAAEKKLAKRERSVVIID